MQPQLATRPRALRHRRGFNLIEAAIVLGVVGLVIGGIWVAATAVSENKRWSDTQAGWLYYMGIVQQRYPASLMATLSGYVDVDQQWAWYGTPAPAGWTNGPSRPLDPYGHAFYAQINNGSIYMGYLNQTPSRQFCAKFLTFIYGQVVDKLVKVAWTGLSCGADTTKTFEYFAANCCPTDQLGWYFTLPG